MVAVNELVTNARQHARTESYGAAVAPELWIHLRSHPEPRLVVTVFDGCCDKLPQLAGADLLDEQGRGLRIVAALAAETGCHLSRSRVTGWPAPGKAVWFTLALDRPWLRPPVQVTPAQAAHRLHGLLISRGLTSVLRGDGLGLSLVSVRHDLNVWVERTGFCFTTIDGARIRRPLSDLQDVAELIVHHCELSSLPPPECATAFRPLSDVRPRSRR